MASAVTNAPVTRRILIVEDDTLVGMGIKAHLQSFGHQVVGQAATTAEALRMYRANLPDLVLLDIRLADSDGLEFAQDLFAERRCPVVIVSAYGDRALIDRAAVAGVFGYLIKPVSAESLQAQIEIAFRRFEELQRLSRENESLVQTLETRKLLERAKGIFMKRLSLDEGEAHRRLQQESQRRRVGLAELARKIIESEELLSPTLPTPVKSPTRA